MKRLLSMLLIATFVAVPNYSFAQNSELVLEEVVVTATKKEENVQDIAQTVNAVTGTTLDDYQIRDLTELSQIVSGVEFTRIDPRRQTIIMRGQKMDPDGTIVMFGIKKVIGGFTLFLAMIMRRIILLMMTLSMKIG